MTILKQMKKIRRINTEPGLPEDCATVLKLCENDVTTRIPYIRHKINVVETNISVVPFLKEGLECMKNELTKTLELQTLINNVIKKYRLNT